MLSANYFHLSDFATKRYKTIINDESGRIQYMKTIKIIPNGPYLVDKEIPLTQEKIAIDANGTSLGWQTIKAYPPQTQAYCLCRCGHSKTKPFCDGTHQKVGFIGSEVALHDHDETIIYEGDTLTLIDEENLCASLRFCDRGIRLWNAVIESNTDDNRNLAIEETRDCASGRMIIKDKKGNVIAPIFKPEISLIQDSARMMRGPLHIKGDIQLFGSDDTPYIQRSQMTLCRCGRSANMPYCDISHLSCKHMEGFDD